jgi:hypothetical protein
MILVATRVLAVAARWLNFRRSHSLRSLRSFAAIPVFTSAIVSLLPRRSGTGNAGIAVTTGNDQSPITNHRSLLPRSTRLMLAQGGPLTNHSGRSV